MVDDLEQQLKDKWFGGDNPLNSVHERMCNLLCDISEAGIDLEQLEEVMKDE